MTTPPYASRTPQLPGQRAVAPHRPAPPEQLLTPGEVASLFGVDAKTVSRWEKTGRLSCIRTLGGHRRFLRSEVDRLLARVDPAPRG